MNIEGYLIVDPSGTPNWWSISHSATQAWEDFREWFRTSVEEVYQAAPTVEDLTLAGYTCVRIDSVGTVVTP